MSTICMPFWYEPASAYWRPPMRRELDVGAERSSVPPFFSSYGRCSRTPCSSCDRPPWRTRSARAGGAWTRGRVRRTANRRMSTCNAAARRNLRAAARLYAFVRAAVRGFSSGRTVASICGPQLLEPRRDRQLLAERLERLVDGEAGARGGQLEQHAAGLAEVDRLEVVPVDHLRRVRAMLGGPLAARPRGPRRPSSTPRGGRCRRPGCRARRAARRRSRGRRARRRAPPSPQPCPRSRGPPRAARGCAPGPTRRRATAWKP